MKFLLLSLLFAVPILPSQTMEINIQDKTKKIVIHLVCHRCGKSIDLKENFYIILGPKHNRYTHYLCEECSQENEDIVSKTEESSYVS